MVKWKMRIILFIAIILCMIPLAHALEECTAIVTPSDIPCRITSTFDPGTCSDYNATVFNSTGTTLATYELDELGTSGLCNFTFYFSEKGDYPINITTGETALVHVKEDNMLGIIIGIIAIIIFYILVGIITDLPALKILSWGLAVIEIVIVPALLYAREAGKDIVGLLRVNFYAMVIIFSLIGFLVLVYYSIRLLDVSDNNEDLKWKGNGKW